MKLSVKDYKKLLAQLKGSQINKYKAVKRTVNGIKFASTREANRYIDLSLLLDAGAISDLRLQPQLPIYINGTKVFTYVADFAYVEAGALVIEDSKGVRTAVYRLKKKCVEAYYGLQIRET